MQPFLPPPPPWQLSGAELASLGEGKKWVSTWLQAVPTFLLYCKGLRSWESVPEVDQSQEWLVGRDTDEGND